MKVCRPRGTSRGEHRANDTTSTFPDHHRSGTTESIATNGTESTMAASFPGHPDQPTAPRMLTVDEEHTLRWLVAERDWHDEQAHARWMDERLRRESAELLQQQIDLHASYAKAKSEHETLLTTATGLRRAVLERHEPDIDLSSHSAAECAVCYAGQDHYETFPCDDYVLARDWRDS